MQQAVVATPYICISNIFYSLPLSGKSSSKQLIVVIIIYIIVMQPKSNPQTKCIRQVSSEWLLLCLTNCFRYFVSHYHKSLFPPSGLLAPSVRQA